MDIMELGAIGELIGGVAVIGSLIFVGIQIRGSTKASEAAARNAWVADYNALLLSVRDDPAWMKTFRMAVADFDGLSNNEQACVHVFLGAHMLNGQNVYEATRTGQFNPQVADSYLDFCASMIKSPGIGQWWRSMRNAIHPDFSAVLDERASRSDLVPLHEALPWYGLEAGEAAEADGREA